MRISKLCLLMLLAVSSALARARVSGYCEQGGQLVVTSGVNSTTAAQASYPTCSITVYYTGGPAGTVTTLGGPTVFWANGTVFSAYSGMPGTWAGLTMTINSLNYTILSCSSTISCTLTTSVPPGTPPAVAYSMASTTPAPIYSNNTGTPSSNPFPASGNGYWGFYADNGTYDINASGGTPPNTIPTPFTWGAVSVFDPANTPLYLSDSLIPSAYSNLAALCNAAALLTPVPLITITHVRYVSAVIPSCPAPAIYPGGQIIPEIFATTANASFAATTATASSGASSLTVMSAPGIVVGQQAVGAGIPAGALVATVSGTTVSISPAMTTARRPARPL
jgi:hypothetical protein